jgi:hypothetical protein
MHDTPSSIINSNKLIYKFKNNDEKNNFKKFKFIIICVCSIKDFIFIKNFNLNQ